MDSESDRLPRRFTDEHHAVSKLPEQSGPANRRRRHRTTRQQRHRIPDPQRSDLLSAGVRFSQAPKCYFTF
jgi:hypothetical protein